MFRQIKFKDVAVFIIFSINTVLCYYFDKTLWCVNFYYFLKSIQTFLIYTVAPLYLKTFILFCINIQFFAVGHVVIIKEPSFEWLSAHSDFVNILPITLFDYSKCLTGTKLHFDFVEYRH